MPLTLHVQLSIILYSILSGILIGVLFDFYRVIRGNNVSGVIVFIEDILFFVLIGITTFVYFLYTNYPYFNVYVYIFMILTLIFYFIFCSKYVYRVQNKTTLLLVGIVRVVIKNILYPFRVFILKISSKK